MSGRQARSDVSLSLGDVWAVESTVMGFGDWVDSDGRQESESRPGGGTRE